MKIRPVRTFVSLALASLLIPLLNAQRGETADGVRIVHNTKPGKWGKAPKVSLEFIKTFGDIESEDENVLFYMPSDMAFDAEGHIYILDSGNHRIQKFRMDGTFVATFGGKGQGPGEFQFPQSMDVGGDGYLYVADMGNQRIEVLEPDGASYKTLKMGSGSLGTIRLAGPGSMIMGGGSGFLSFGPGGMEEKQQPPLFKMLSLEGEVIGTFGEPHDFKDVLLNRMGNRCHFSVGPDGSVYAAFDFQNRIEKYSSEGKLIWRADRKLNFSTDPPDTKGSISGSRGQRMVRMPEMNRCASGIALDSKGRVWVVGLKRQMKEEERVGTEVRATMGAGGRRTMAMSVVGNTELQKTDMYQLEVYDQEGVLLGMIPLDRFVDDIRIVQDRIFLLDRMRGMQISEYRLIN